MLLVILLIIFVVVGAGLLANSVNQICLCQVHLLVQAALTQDLVKRLRVRHLHAQLRLREAVLEDLPRWRLLADLELALRLHLLERALQAEACSFACSFETSRQNRLLLSLLVLGKLPVGQRGHLNCILSWYFLLGVLSFLKASVALHQKLLEALDIILVVFDIALEELEELILFATLSIGTPLMHRPLSLPCLLVEVCSLILEASLLIMNLLRFLDVQWNHYRVA